MAPDGRDDMDYHTNEPGLTPHEHETGRAPMPGGGAGPSVGGGTEDDARTNVGPGEPVGEADVLKETGNRTVSTTPDDVSHGSGGVR